MKDDNFVYSDERFADLQLLRYRLNSFDNLSVKQKCLVYCLAKATLFGRDITFDQQGRYNLRIRQLMEIVYVHFSGNRDCSDFKALEIYLKRIWFSNGIYHHYGCEKIMPGFNEDFLRSQKELFCKEKAKLLCSRGEHPDNYRLEQDFEELIPIIFDKDVLPKRVNKKDGEDLVRTSACNFYRNVTQTEVEDFYARKKTDDDEQPSWGLNSMLIKENGELKEKVWKVNGMYGEAIRQIIYWLLQAEYYAENEKQLNVIRSLIKFYETGDLADFDQYSIKWVEAQEGTIDFVNGFIEVYGDPLGLKATWEGIVEIKDMEATRRTQLISQNAQWFEDHSPVDKRFKKTEVKGVTAHVVEAAMLGGEEYPSSAIGINLPNADWIRASYGSKSVTISNLTEAYDQAASGNGFDQEFIFDNATRELVEKWGNLCDNIHTDLHECLGHGSGKLLEKVDPDSLKAYGNTIEEARADLFGLYYIADEKMVELGLVADRHAYKAQYYKYMLNGLLTQLVRIKPGQQIEEAHMRNRALVARWALEHGRGAVELVCKKGKTFIQINDYEQLRTCFATLLAEVQRIKSEGDYTAARNLVEQYAVKVDPVLHQEILERYKKLNIAPYKGFINPRMYLETDEKGKVTNVKLDYTEGYAEQMLRYSKDYATLI